MPTLLLVSDLYRSSAIEYLINQFKDDTMVVYYYFNYQSKDLHTAVQIARTILKQLISGVDIPEELESLYKKCIEESKNPDIEELVPILQSCSRKFSSRYAVYDALDECSDMHRSEILNLFGNLQKFGYKLLISGRSPLDPGHFSNVSAIEIRAMDQDIERYIMKNLDEHNARPKVRAGCLELVKVVDGM